MNYIYGILCHRMTNPLRFLISSLCNTPNTKIIIHVDKKTEITTFLEEFSNHSQIIFVQNRVNVLWGNFSQIEAILELLKLAQQQPYHYFSLLSGDDIPLQSISSFHHFLEMNKNEFIDLDKNPDCKIEPRIRFRYGTAFFNKQRSPKELRDCKWQKKLFKIGLNRNNINHLPKLYKGSTWFTLSSTAVDYIFDYLIHNPKYIAPFQTSLCGDEIFFHTIMFNSPFLSNIKTKDHMGESFTRYIDWNSGPDFPRTLSEVDFDQMKASGMFFARKLQYDTPLEILKHNFDF